MLTIRDQIAMYASDGREGYAIADAVFANIIVRLRRDKRFRGMSTFELELLLADARGDAERQLYNKLRGRVHVEDIDDLGEAL